MSDNSAVPEVSLDDLAQALEQGAAVVDVREVDEYVTARIPGVQLIPLSEFQARWEEIPTSGTVYVVCAAGGRSRKAAAALRQAGVDAVNVTAGTMGWQKEGRPIESGQ